MSMFQNAKTLAAPKTPKAKAEKPIVQIDGLQQLCEVRALIAALGTVADTLDSTVKSQAEAYFVATAVETHKRPENVRGTDLDGGEATASIELKKRSTASALTDEQVEILTKAGVKVEENVKTQFLFAVNPVYAGNQTLLAKVEKALKNVVPEDFFVTQAEVKTNVVGETTLDEVFAHADVEALMPIVTTLSVKPSLPNPDIGAIMKKIAKLITPPTKKG